MLKLLRNLRRQEWAMAAVCAVLILGQINFDLALPDYMSKWTVLIKTPGSTLSDILHTGPKCWAALPGQRGAVRHLRLSDRQGGCRVQLFPSGRRCFIRSQTSANRR